MLKKWLGSATDVLISPLPQDACFERLRETVESDESPVIGTIGAQSFRLRKRLPPDSYNSFQTYLHATVVSEVAATRLICRSGPHGLVIAFVAFWFLALLGIALAMQLIVSTGGLHPGLAAPLIMAPMGLAIVGFGRYMARDERAFLLDFLRETIDARAAAPGRTPGIQRVVQR